MRVAMYYSNQAIFSLPSLRGAPVHRGDEAILVEGHEIATPRQVGAHNDKANQQTTFSPLPRWERSKVRVRFFACGSE